MSGNAMALLRVLADRADKRGRLFAGQETLADDRGVSRRTIMRAFAELEAAGWVERERRHRRDGTRTSDLVTLRDLEGAAAHIARALQLPLMVAISGGKPVDNTGDQVTNWHLGLSDNLAQQEPISQKEESNQSERRAVARGDRSRARAFSKRSG